MKRRRHAAQGGFSLVELLVTLAILTVTLAIANRLLLEGVRIFSASGRELREPSSELALRLLREDIRASLPTPYPGGLKCQRSDRVERWEVDNERLVRVSEALDGAALARRPILDGVLLFAASSPQPGLVHVEIVRRRPAGASALRSATSAWASRGETLEAATVVAGSRISFW